MTVPDEAGDKMRSSNVPAGRSKSGERHVKVVAVSIIAGVVTTPPVMPVKGVNEQFTSVSWPGVKPLPDTMI